MIRIGYQPEPKHAFSDLEPGTYHVKYYIRTGEERNSYYIRDIEVPENDRAKKE